MAITEEDVKRGAGRARAETARAEQFQDIVWRLRSRE